MKKSFSRSLLTILFLFAVFTLNTFADNTTKKYDFKDFHAVDVSSGMKLKVTQSSSYSIEITADADYFDDLVVEKKGGTLEIYFKKHFFSFFGHHHRVEINITMPSLTGLGLSGGSSANINMDVAPKSFSADLSGGSYFEGNLKCAEANFELSGGSVVKLSGKSGNTKIDGSGGSIFKLKEFPAADFDAELSGGSQATISMNGTLNADLSGGSHVYYYGKVELGSTDFSGGSGISRGKD